MLFFIIRLFAVWRYAGRIFNAGICRGKAISEFRSPKALPLHPHPLRYLYGGTLCRSTISFLYSSIFIVVRWADLVPGFFGTYSGTLRRSGSGISSIFTEEYSVPVRHFRTGRPVRFHPPHVFSCRLEVSARGRWHRAGLLRRRGDYYLGCGRRRYCGRVCCLSRRRVLTLPQCF